MVVHVMFMAHGPWSPELVEYKFILEAETSGERETYPRACLALSLSEGGGQGG